MKYLCLVYQEEAKLDALSSDELDTLMADCHAWVEDVESSGRSVSCTALHSVRMATTVRRRDGTVWVSDGPFAETKEQLAGCVLVDARDLNEAIRLASRLPAARLGSVEVRPVLEPDVEPADPFDRKIAAALRRAAPGPVEVRPLQELIP